jgi:hypothetical protein
MKDSGTEACFGCLNISCKKHFHMKRERLSRSGLLRSLPALLIPAAGFVTGFALPGLLVSDAAEALQAACGMASLFVSAGAWYILHKKYQPKSNIQAQSPAELVRKLKFPKTLWYFSDMHL